MGLVEAGGMGWGQKDPYLPKIFSTHPTMMKLGTIIPYKKKIQKYINHQKSATVVISRKTDIDCILIHIF